MICMLVKMEKWEMDVIVAKSEKEEEVFQSRELFQLQVR
jgi:hypothetical protein